MPFYAAIVAGSFFLLTNNADDFQKAANALENGESESDLHRSPDLTSLRTHAYWAYRGIRQGKEVRGLPQSSIGLEMFTDFGDGELFFSIMVPDDGTGSHPAGLPSSESIHFQRVEADLWQAAISLTTRQAGETLFQLLFYFGYGVIV